MDEAAPLLHAADLHARGRALRAPFALRFARAEDDREIEIRCDEVLRLLPGKRIVARARFGLDGSDVLLKLFIDRRCNANAERELTGLQRLRAAGFATPDVITKGRLRNDGGYGLMLHYVKSARSLSAVWRDGDALLRERVLIALVTRLAALHAADAWQMDLHLDNFLLDGDALYAIDGGAVRIAPKTGGESFGLDNLALLHAQLPLADDALLSVSLSAYSTARGWRSSARRELFLRNTVAQHRALRVARYLRKIHRECTEFEVTRSTRAFTVLQRDLAEELQELLADPDMAIAAGEVLKAGRSATVARVRGRHQWWVIKRYNLKGTVHALSRSARRTRAEWSWRNAQHMKLLGIATAQPVALHVETLGPLRGRGYFVMEALAGTPLDERLRMGWRPGPEFLAELSALFAQLLNQRLVHGDMKATNFVVTDRGVRLVDLDGMREVRDVRRLGPLFARDIARFQANWAGDAELAAVFSKVSVQLAGRT